MIFRRKSTRVHIHIYGREFSIKILSDIRNNIRKRIFKAYKKNLEIHQQVVKCLYSTLYNVDNEFAMLLATKFE